MDRNLVFIASGGRTGTQFFGKRLSGVIDDCHSAHEPDVLFASEGGTLAQIHSFGLWHMIFGRLLGLTGVRVLGQRLMTGSISEEACIGQICRSRKGFHQSIRESLLIESNYQWWYLVDQVQELWPHAKVIAIIRDPRDWVRSWLNKGERYTRWDRANLFPPGRLTPEKLGQAEWAARWAEWGPFEKLAWEWRTTYAHLDANIRRSENSRMFRFEDLFKPDSLAMRELVEFAATHGEKRYPVKDLTGFSDTVMNASVGEMPAWRNWSADEAQLLHELCGPLMNRYGYGNEAEWLEKLRGANG